MSELFGGSVWKEMADRIRKETSNYLCQTESANPSKPLTFADLEKTMQDIDPDGRLLQEARLCAACRKLTKEQVETLIMVAEVGFNIHPFTPRSFPPMNIAFGDLAQSVRPADKEPCRCEHLNEDGICRNCGADRRRG